MDKKLPQQKVLELLAMSVTGEARHRYGDAFLLDANPGWKPETELDPPVRARPPSCVHTAL